MVKTNRFRQRLQAVILAAALAFTGVTSFGPDNVYAAGSGREARREAKELLEVKGPAPSAEDKLMFKKQSVS